MLGCMPVGKVKPAGYLGGSCVSFHVSSCLCAYHTIMSERARLKSSASASLRSSPLGPFWYKLRKSRKTA
eukprot:5072518-Prymnesium_polylepis.2